MRLRFWNRADAVMVRVSSSDTHHAPGAGAGASSGTCSPGRCDDGEFCGMTEVALAGCTLQHAGCTLQHAGCGLQQMFVATPFVC